MSVRDHNDLVKLDLRQRLYYSNVSSQYFTLLRWAGCSASKPGKPARNNTVSVGATRTKLYREPIIPMRTIINYLVPVSKRFINRCAPCAAHATRNTHQVTAKRVHTMSRRVHYSLSSGFPPIVKDSIFHAIYVAFLKNSTEKHVALTIFKLWTFFFIYYNFYLWKYHHKNWENLEKSVRIYFIYVF